jgi:decaprenyl-phosphate phosphoribosyltransferase
MTTLSVAARPAVARELLLAARPRQWGKNLLVFAAPLAAGTLTHGRILLLALVAFAVFVAASAGTYLLNDVYDAERDRAHPVKMLRPVASGRLNLILAAAAGMTLLSIAVAFSLAVDRELLAVIVATYGALVVAYGAGVKQIPGMELLVVSAGFVLRPLAGAAATGVRPSGWFLAVCSLASLTIAIGKRQVELIRLGSTAALHRPALGSYSVRWLRRCRMLVAVLTVGAYSGWSLSGVPSHQRVAALVSLVPIVFGLVRLGWLNDRGVGGAPEEVVVRDRWLLAACVVWLVTFVGGLGRV